MDILFSVARLRPLLGCPSRNWSYPIQVSATGFAWRHQAFFMGTNKITNNNMVFVILSSPFAFGGASSSLVAATSSLAMVVSYLVG
jgi:hypothetical protein